MKTKFLTLIIFIFTTFSFCQTTIIEYDFELAFPKEKLEDENIGFYLQGAQRGTKQLKLTLTYNDSLSLFKAEEALSINDDYEMALVMANCKEKIFQKKGFNYVNNSDLVFQKEKYIVKDSIKSNWKLNKESKIINNIECYKAIMVEKMPLATIKEKNIVAWFAPELASNFGPGGFGNLPGTILILQNGDVIYKVSKITTKSNEKISFDLKGELLISEDYYKISNDAFEKAMDGK